MSAAQYLVSYTPQQVYTRLCLDPTYKEKRSVFTRKYGGSSRQIGKTTDALVHALSLLSQEKTVYLYTHSHQESERIFKLAETYAKKLFPNTLRTVTVQYKLSRGSGVLVVIPYSLRHTVHGVRVDESITDIIDYTCRHVHRVLKDSRMCVGCGVILRGRVLANARYKRALLRENPEMLQYVRAHDSYKQVEVKK